MRFDISQQLVQKIQLALPNTAVIHRFGQGVEASV